MFLALLSGALWGTSDFAGGALSRRRPALAVAGISQAVGLVVAAALAVGTGAWRAPRDFLLWGVLAGLTGLVGLVCFYVALAIGSMSVVSPIAATGVVVPVVAGLVRGERPAGVQLAGIVIAVVGIVLASGPEMSGRAGGRPLLLAAAAAAAFGVALLCITLGSRTSVVMTMLTMRVCSVSVVVVIGLKVRSAGGVGRRDLGQLALVGLFDVTANLTFGAASTRGLVSLVAVLGSLYPVVTVLLARFLHGERLGVAQNVGVVASLGGVALIAAG